MESVRLSSESFWAYLILLKFKSFSFNSMWLMWLHFNLPFLLRHWQIKFELQVFSRSPLLEIIANGKFSARHSVQRYSASLFSSFWEILAHFLWFKLLHCMYFSDGSICLFCFYIQSRKVYLPPSFYLSSFGLSQRVLKFLRNLVKQNQNLLDCNSNRTIVCPNLNNFGNIWQFQIIFPLWRWCSNSLSERPLHLKWRHTWQELQQILLLFSWTFSWYGQ